MAAMSTSQHQPPKLSDSKSPNPSVGLPLRSVHCVVKNDGASYKLEAAQKTTWGVFSDFWNNPQATLRASQWIFTSAGAYLNSTIAPLGEAFGVTAGICAIAGFFEGVTELSELMARVVKDGFSNATAKKIGHCCLKILAKLGDLLVSLVKAGALFLSSRVLYIVKVVKETASVLGDIIDITDASLLFGKIDKDETLKAIDKEGKEADITKAKAKLIKSCLALGVHTVTLIAAAFSMMVLPMVGMTILVGAYIVSIIAKHFIDAKADATINKHTVAELNNRVVVTSKA